MRKVEIFSEPTRSMLKQKINEFSESHKIIQASYTPTVSERCGYRYEALILYEIN